jgi:hypothetical protein
MDKPTDQQRYAAAAHAMQSGVAAKQGAGIGNECEPKHLRVGINAAMSDHGALVRLLICKGLFTEAEYMAAIADGMEAEKASYERSLSEHYGKQITLV